MVLITELDWVTLAGIGATQFALGVLIVFGIYRMREYGVAAGFLGGIGLVTAVVSVQYWIAMNFFSLSPPEGDLIVVVSGLAGLTAGALASVALEPEIDHRGRGCPAPRPEEQLSNNRSLDDFIEEDIQPDVSEAVEAGETDG